ncbi:protein rolling stone-like [Amphiura filiformis]|uniref:protein rolling stone-like n=1 Tax=Amphiura filiformis TaxID=82378 RepID=UPI003B221CD4
MDHTTQSGDSWRKKLNRILRREFSPELIGFNGVHANKFATPLIYIPFQPYSWILYRFVTAFYLKLWMVLHIMNWEKNYPRESDSKAKMFLYLSNWVYSLLCAYFLFSAVSTLVHHLKTACKDTSTTVNREDQQITKSIECSGQDPCKNITLPWYFKITWFLQNLAFVGTIMVTILRWGVDIGDNPMKHASDIHIHGIGLIFVCIDIFVIASPFRLQHVVYPLIFGLIYSAFTGFFYLAGGTKFIDDDKNTSIYETILDWGTYPKEQQLL